MGEWGEAFYADGTSVPLQAPADLIPEGEREYLHKSDGITIWTRKDES